jgi:hypothetical protein
MEDYVLFEQMMGEILKEGNTGDGATAAMVPAAGGGTEARIIGIKHWYTLRRIICHPISLCLNKSYLFFMLLSVVVLSVVRTFLNGKLHHPLELDKWPSVDNNLYPTPSNSLVGFPVTMDQWLRAISYQTLCRSHIRYICYKHVSDDALPTWLFSCVQQ